jgi:hypothetical protein
MAVSSADFIIGFLMRVINEMETACDFGAGTEISPEASTMRARFDAT